MSYCKKCNYFSKDDIDRCPNCKQYMVKEAPENDAPVIAIRTAGIEHERITAALQDSKIPFSERFARKQASANVVTGVNSASVDIIVNYKDYEKTYDLLVGIGAIKLDGEEIIDEVDEKQPVKKSVRPGEEEFEEMSTRKRIIVRILSAILFIVVVWGVVVGVDYVMALVKGLFI
ncbi:MAG TPA: hypothetical protein GX401_02400 [Clostridiales bacterium]|nr:hypothetical protein [Clostridiales bacterium]